MSCNCETEVLVLELKHWERLFVKRNPHAIDAMKKSLDLRLRHRFTKVIQDVPLFQLVVARACGMNRDELKPEVLRAGEFGEDDAFSLPPRGGLVDIFGPGTAFHRIRKRESAKAKKKKYQKSFSNDTTDIRTEDPDELSQQLQSLAKIVGNSGFESEEDVAISTLNRA